MSWLTFWHKSLSSLLQLGLLLLTNSFIVSVIYPCQKCLPQNPSWSDLHFVLQHGYCHSVSCLVFYAVLDWKGYFIGISHRCHWDNKIDLRQNNEVRKQITALLLVRSVKEFYGTDWNKAPNFVYWCVWASPSGLEGSPKTQTKVWIFVIFFIICIYAIYAIAFKKTCTCSLRLQLIFYRC